MDRNAKFIVLDKAAFMPASCWGRYRKVAVVELTDSAAGEGLVPAMISERARGVRRVVRVWDKLHKGKTDRCAYRRGLVEAVALAALLNAQE